VRRGWGNYYFGDYFGAPYTRLGFTAWCGTIGPRGGFAIGFGTGRSWGYDPLWSYYSVAYRNNRNWSNGFNTLYAGRYNGTISPPPRTLVQQNTVINNISNVNVKNVTNNITVVNRNVTVNKKDVTAVTMVAPTRVVKDLQPEARIQPISAQVRRQEAQHAQQIRSVGVERTKLESAALVKGPGGKQANAQPRTLQLNIPKDVVARSQVKDEKRGPPPNPHLNARIEPKGKGEPFPKGKGNGEPFPKGKGEPLPEPKGKGEPFPRSNGEPFPKGKGEPMPNPKGKGEPFPNGKGEPFPNPRGKGDPFPDPRGKGDPFPKGKGEPMPFPKGKGEPFPKGNPLPDPKGKGEPFPFPRGKGDPFPKGKMDPKYDPKSKNEPPFPRGRGEPPPPFPKGGGQPDPDHRGKKKDKEEPKPPGLSDYSPLARVRPPMVNPSTLAPGRPLGRLQPQPQRARQPLTIPSEPTNNRPRPPAARPPVNRRPVVQPKFPQSEPRMQPSRYTPPAHPRGNPPPKRKQPKRSGEKG